MFARMRGGCAGLVPILSAFVAIAVTAADGATGPYRPEVKDGIGGAGELELYWNSGESFKDFPIQIDGESFRRSGMVGSSGDVKLYLQLDRYWPWRERTVFHVFNPQGTDPSLATAVVRRVNVTVRFADAPESLRNRFPSSAGESDGATGVASIDTHWCQRHGLKNPCQTISKLNLIATREASAEGRLSVVIELKDRIPTPPARYVVFVNGFTARLHPDGYFTLEGVPAVERDSRIIVNVTAVRSLNDPTIPPVHPFGVALLREPMRIPISPPHFLERLNGAISNTLAEFTPVLDQTIAMTNAAQVNKVAEAINNLQQRAKSLLSSTNELTPHENMRVTSIAMHAEDLARAFADHRGVARVRAEQTPDRFGLRNVRAERFQAVLGQYATNLARHAQTPVQPSPGVAIEGAESRTLSVTNRHHTSVYYLDLSAHVRSNAPFLVTLEGGVTTNGRSISPRYLVSGRYNPVDEPHSIWVGDLQQVHFRILASTNGPMLWSH